MKSSEELSSHVGLHCEGSSVPMSSLFPKVGRSRTGQGHVLKTKRERKMCVCVCHEHDGSHVLIIRFFLSHVMDLMLAMCSFPSPWQDHCAKKLLPWFDGLMEANVRAHGGFHRISFGGFWGGRSLAACACAWGARGDEMLQASKVTMFNRR